MTLEGNSPMNRSGEDDESTPLGICGAKTRAGGICAKPAMANGRCNNHGGKSLSGINAPSFRHGRHSKALAKLDADIGDRLEDPALLDPRRTIAVQEYTLARLNELLEDRDSPEFREDVKKRVMRVLELVHTDHDATLRELDSLRGFVMKGVEESRALTALGNAADLMNKSQNRYWQTAMTAARSISPEEFIQLMFRMADIIEEEVDKDAARRILGRTDREVCAGALGLSEQ